MLSIIYDDWVNILSAVESLPSPAHFGQLGTSRVTSLENEALPIPIPTG